MSHEQFEAMCERLTRVEAENRLLKRIGGAFLAVVLTSLCGAWADRDDGVLKGKQLELTSRAGDSRIILGESPEGLPAITLERRAGDKMYSMRQELYVAGDGTPILIFVDHTGTRRYKIPR